MVSHIAFLMVLMATSVYGAFCFEKRFEKTIPCGCMAIVAMLFIAGIVGPLRFGFYTVLMFSGIAYALSIYAIVAKKRLAIGVRNLFTPGFCVFFALYLVLTFCNYGMQAMGNDEFSHWMDCVKVMTQLDCFATNPQAHSLYPSYPPAMALFQYFAQRLHLLFEPASPFNEWKMFFAYQVFSMVLLLPIYKRWTWKKWYEMVVVVMLMVILPLVLYRGFYGEISIDPFVGILAGSGMSYILFEDEKDSIYILRVSLLCFTLTMAKDAGMLFACFVALAFMIDIIARKKWDVKAFIPFAMIFGSKGLWKWKIAADGAKVVYGERMRVGQFFYLLFGGTSGDYRENVVDAFRDAFVSKGIQVGDSSLVVSYLSLWIVAVMLIGILGVINVEKEQRRWGKCVVWSLLIIQSLVYMIGLGVMYISTLSDYEAVRMASFERYMNMGFLPIAIVVGFGVVNSLCGINFKSTAVVLVVLSAVLCVMLPARELREFLLRQYVNRARDLRWQYKEMTEQIHQIGDKNARIYVIAQGDKGYSKLVLAYEARPYWCKNSWGWSLGDPCFEGDIWTVPMSSEELWNTLDEGYDYVALYAINEDFREKYSALFENESRIAANTLYRIDRERELLVRYKE